MFASVFVCSSQDAKVTWTKVLMKATPQKKTLRRSSEVQETKEVLLGGLSVRGTPDSPVCPGGTPDCPVPHVGLFGASRNSSPTASSR